jgi:LmbE family N-acetylglucosaminyl deacetylase
MATLVCFHAHPDDEAIATGGTMARAADLGHRVVLVVATGGEHGEVPDDLAPGESLADRRHRETLASAEALGIHRVVRLGYADSGMTGWDQNGHDGAFMRAPVEEAAARLAAILQEEAADVLTVYDWHGNYGHPDHIQVHRVGHRAAELAGTAHVYEATMNRDEMQRLTEAARAAGISIGDEQPDGEGERTPQTDDGEPFGQPESELTTRVDVVAYLDRKRAALRAHASQISDSSFFLRMPDEVFAMAFGTEWFTRIGVERHGIVEDWLAGL